MELQARTELPLATLAKFGGQSSLAWLSWPGSGLARISAGAVEEEERRALEHVRLEHPATAAHRPNRVGTQHPSHTDEQRIAAPLAEVSDADPPREFTTADHAADVLSEHEENSPLLCAQMSEGVDDI